MQLGYLCNLQDSKYSRGTLLQDPGLFSPNNMGDPIFVDTLLIELKDGPIRMTSEWYDMNRANLIFES